jgi:hypothetical protein
VQVFSTLENAKPDTGYIKNINFAAVKLATLQETEIPLWPELRMISVD